MMLVCIWFGLYRVFLLSWIIMFKVHVQFMCDTHLLFADATHVPLGIAASSTRLVKGLTF